MSVFNKIRELKGSGQFEEAWQHGFAVLQEDQQNTFLQTQLFWVIYAALKQKINPIKKRKVIKPLPEEQAWIDTWTTRISELNLILPTKNIDYRLWNLFLKSEDVGQFCTPLCLYILVSGRALFRPEDYKPYRTEKGESPSIVYKLARMVAANYLQFKDNSPIPVGRITEFLQYAFDTTQDTVHKIWISHDKAKVLAASGQMERARQGFLDVLEKKPSESWAWFSLATTYQDEPLKASSLIAYGLTCAHDPKYSVKGLSHLVNLLAQQKNYADASRALLRLNSIYQKNGWQLKKEVVELMTSPWYDASLDEAPLDITIRTLASTASQHIAQHPVVYKGVVIRIHNSGKGADIYIGPEQTMPVLRSLFYPRDVFNVGTFVELLCDNRSAKEVPVSVKKISPFTSDNIRFFSGMLKLTERGFGFVDNIFVPPFIAKKHKNGDKIAGIAVLTFDKKKNSNSFAAVVTE